ncbi:MAG: very short patch repair endonuclease [Bryobacteraceae bacterium]
MDHVSKEVRSKIMAAVRSKGNRSTEIALGKLMWAAGLRGYRKQWPVAGRPDFAWPGRKIAIFVDGCFWHGCPKCKSLPRTNRAFWRNKIETNQERDRRVTRGLRREGWAVIRVWECAVRTARTLARIGKILAERRLARLAAR